MARENEELTEEARKNTTSKRGERRGLLTTLVGVTCAFVIGSMIFVGTMLLLNNPFERVEDIKVPNLLGLDYESIKDSAEYADFNIVVKESGYNAEYPVGQIYDQSPSEGRTVKSGATIEVKVSQWKVLSGQRALPRSPGRRSTTMWCRPVWYAASTPARAVR